MNNRAFTLIELLVSIAIIGILASIVIGGVGIVRKKGRDARRIQDVKELQKALSQYVFTNGTFPIATASTSLTGADSVSTALVGSQVMPVMSKDPLYPNPLQSYYTYQSNATGNEFWISFCMETDSLPPYTTGCNNIVSP